MRLTNFQEFFSNFLYFLKKSLKVSLFADKLLIHNDLQNDTSKYVYKEAS